MVGVNIDVTARRAADQAREARDRAAQLARANEALTRSTAQLAATPELHAFIGTVLTEAAQQAGALSNALFLYDPETQAVSMRAYVRGGSLIDRCRRPSHGPMARSGAGRSIFHLDGTEPWRTRHAQD